MTEEKAREALVELEGKIMRFVTDSFLYLCGDDPPGWEAHMRPDEVVTKVKNEIIRLIEDS